MNSIFGLPITFRSTGELMMRRIIKDMDYRAGVKNSPSESPRSHLLTPRVHRIPFRRGERGQVAILFALVFTFMFILFAFVVDFGHLINAKINLQLAADAAAYAGAAWQARTLNRIGQVNYKLRQDLKEMAMRVHVTHLRHNRNYPRGQGYISGGGSAPNTEPFMCQQAHGYVALSGLRYANDTNLCRNASPSVGGLPPIVVPPVIASFDPFAHAIAAQIRKIAEAANQECRAAAQDNRRLAEHLISVYTRRSNFHSQQIRALTEWLNSVGGGKINENASHPINQVAYESARRNLSFANRDNFEIQVLEPQGSEYLRINEHKLRASLFFFDFNVVGDGCVGKPGYIDFNDMVVGITKDPPIITYYAVKLSSTPRMLFMPQNWLSNDFPVLEAYAAAKPFGSRLGPDSTTDQLAPVPNRPGNSNRMVNFSFKPGDRLGIMNTKIMAYLDALHPFNSAGRPEGNQTQGWPEPDKSDNIRQALQAIRAPTIFDAAFFTIHPDPNRSEDYYESDYAMNLYPDYLEAAGPDNNVISTPEPVTRQYFPDGVGPAVQRGAGWIAVSARAEGGQAYGNYATEQPATHSVTLAPNSIPDISEGNAGDFGWATKEQLHSGWAPATGQPRIGYSVKLIGFDALMRTMIVRLNESGTTGRISNPPTGDSNLSQIYH